MPWFTDLHICWQTISDVTLLLWFLQILTKSYKNTTFSIVPVVLDSRGHTKGYGFVRFAEETEQQKALIEMQHTTGIGRKPIRVSLATPKKYNYL